MIFMSAFLFLSIQVPEAPTRTRAEEASLIQKNNWSALAEPAGEGRGFSPIEIKILISRIPPKLERFGIFSVRKSYPRGMDPKEYLIELLPIAPSEKNIRVKAQRPIIQSSEDPRPGPATWILGDLPPGLPQCRGFNVFDPEGVFLGQRLFEVSQELPPVQVEIEDDGWMRIVCPLGYYNHVEHRISLDDGMTWTSYAVPFGVFQHYFTEGLSAFPKKPILEILVIKDLRFEYRRIRLDGFKRSLLTARGAQKLE